MICDQIMLDIETLGTKPGSAIVSIGACSWSMDHDEIGDTFYCNINAASCVQHGMHMDPSTVMWWMGQSDQARAALTNGASLSLPDAIDVFTQFVIDIREKTTGRKDIGIWGNDNTFDIVLTEHAYNAVNKAVPWAFWESRSVRTLVALGARLGFNVKKDFPRQGTHHNALDDAIHQARYCRHISRLLFPQAAAETDAA